MKKAKVKKHKHHKKQKLKKRRRASSSDSSSEGQVRACDMCGDYQVTLCGYLLPPYVSRALQCCLCRISRSLQARTAVQKHKHQKARKRRHASVSSSSTDDMVPCFLRFCVVMRFYAPGRMSKFCIELNNVVQCRGTSITRPENGGRLQPRAAAAKSGEKRCASWSAPLPLL